jgi:hypothetical protein
VQHEPPQDREQVGRDCPRHSAEPSTKTAAAYEGGPRAEDRVIELRLAADTCGLSNWKQPEGWDRTPFSHTVTIVDGLSGGWDAGWNIYNSGVIVAFIQPRAI